MPEKILKVSSTTYLKNKSFCFFLLKILTVKLTHVTCWQIETFKFKFASQCIKHFLKTNTCYVLANRNLQIQICALMYETFSIVFIFFCVILYVWNRIGISFV